MRILIVEDNPKLAESVQLGLQDHGYQSDVIRDGYDAEEAAASGEYSVVLLDLMLPDRDGMEIARNLRRRKVTTPILMLTALADTNDKVAGLDAGADDYLAKPFAFEELLARLRALTRRGEPSEASQLEFHDLHLDLARREATRQGELISLTSREFALLEYLVRNPNRVLTRTQIGEHVWDMNFDASSNVIDVYISMLRKKVDKPFDIPLIHTVVGSGYMLSQTAPAASA